MPTMIAENGTGVIRTNTDGAITIQIMIETKAFRQFLRQTQDGRRSAIWE
jgi:hypothetical protein